MLLHFESLYKHLGSVFAGCTKEDRDQIVSIKAILTKLTTCYVNGLLERGAEALVLKLHD